MQTSIGLRISDAARPAATATIWLCGLCTGDGFPDWLQIIVERNNDISRACSRLLGIKSPSFMNLNQMISDHLASVLLPVSRQESWCGHDTVISSILEVCHHLHWAAGSRRMPASPDHVAHRSSLGTFKKDSCSNFVRTLRTGC